MNGKFRPNGHPPPYSNAPSTAAHALGGQGPRSVPSSASGPVAAALEAARRVLAAVALAERVAGDAAAVLAAGVPGVADDTAWLDQTAGLLADALGALHAALVTAWPLAEAVADDLAAAAAATSGPVRAGGEWFTSSHEAVLQTGLGRLVQALAVAGGGELDVLTAVRLSDPSLLPDPVAWTRRAWADVAWALAGLDAVDAGQLDARLRQEAARAALDRRASGQVQPAGEPVPVTVCASPEVGEGAGGELAVVVLRGVDQEPLVMGQRLPPLSAHRYAVMQALVGAGPSGMTKAQLDITSGYGDARKTLKRIAESDPRWAAVLHFPRRRGGGGYRVGPPAH